MSIYASGDLQSPSHSYRRLAALVPPPRLHRYRYFGVLAPKSPLRASTSWALAPANGARADCAPLSSFCGSRRAIGWPGLTLSPISTVRWQADKNVSAHSASATRRKAIGPQWRSRDSVDTGQTPSKVFQSVAWGAAAAGRFVGAGY
jgi:hypothetical protein